MLVCLRTLRIEKIPCESFIKSLYLNGTLEQFTAQRNTAEESKRRKKKNILSTFNFFLPSIDIYYVSVVASLVWIVAELLQEIEVLSHGNWGTL